MEIKNYIVKIYNIQSKKKSTKCLAPCSVSERCVCLDSEQAGILSWTWDNEEIVQLNFDKGRKYFYNTSFEYSLYKRVYLDKELCPHRNENYKLYRFVSCRDKSGLKDVIMRCRENKDKVDFFTKWMEIFPVLQSINSYHDLPYRHTILYLCLIGPFKYPFFKLLLRLLIHRTIWCYKKGELKFGKVLSSYMKEFTDIYKNINIEKDNLCMAIEHCAKAWEDIDIIVTDMYDLYRGEVMQEEMGTFIEGEMIDIKYLYKILKKVLEVTGMKYKEPDNFFIEDIQKDYYHGTYNFILDKLDNVTLKPGLDMNCLLDKLSSLLYRYDEIPDEEISGL